MGGGGYANLRIEFAVIEFCAKTLFVVLQGTGVVVFVKAGIAHIIMWSLCVACFFYRALYPPAKSFQLAVGRTFCHARGHAHLAIAHAHEVDLATGVTCFAGKLFGSQ